MTIDIGPQLAGLLTLILTPLAAWIASRGARKDTTAIAREMTNNGGSSMRDAIDRIEQRQIRTDRRLDAAGIPQVDELPPPPEPSGELT